MIAARSRLLILPLAAAAALLLGACSDDKSDDAAKTTSATTGGESTFLKILQSSGVDTSDHDALIAEGKQVCADLKAGKPMDQILDVTADSGAAARSASMLSASIVAFCPDQQSKLMPSEIPSGMPTLPSQ